jgi:hypothetical protein
MSALARAARRPLYVGVRTPLPKATSLGEHEKRTGKPDLNWPDWYAGHIVREQAGTDLPT